MDIYTFLVIIAFFVTVIALSSGDSKIKAQVISVLSRLLGNGSRNRRDRD